MEHEEFRTYQEILELDFYDLLDYLEHYNIMVPTNIENPQDMKHAGQIIGTACNAYVHLNTLLDYAKREVRIAKDTKNRYVHEEAIDKRDAVEDAVRRMDKIMSSCSRLVTIRSLELRELSINDAK